ncbi:MAG TPA: aminotransferase class V-fold PLP-dependent enzyme, partial [Thermoanaerobaculia bacterium]|nr:aminotransferase class V-fold PLP-dependent enzyme [Thermoanaerobaculia bacterium]
MVAAEIGRGLLTALSEDRVASLRQDTPGCATRVHLNNAGSSLTARPVADAVFRHLQRELEVGGYEAAEEAEERIQGSYGHLARILGTAPRNVAVVENATVAFSQALAAFDFAPGDVLVTTLNDYTSNQIMYGALARRRGLEVLYTEELPEGGFDPDSLRDLARHPRCRLVAVTWVPTNSGLVQDAEAAGAVCEELGVPYLVDACQAVGQIPVDVSRLRCDYLAGTARKFLRGPRGLGFLYVSDRALERGDYPIGIDMRGAERTGDGLGFTLVQGARRFENWEFPYALVLGMGEAARYALEVGIGEGGARAAELAAYAREKLGSLPGVEVKDRGRRLCAIATAEVSGWNVPEVVHRLRESGVNTSASTAEDGCQTPVIRVSPHYYNLREEAD